MNYTDRRPAARANCGHRHREGFRRLCGDVGVFAVPIPDSVVFTTDFAGISASLTAGRAFLTQ